jgi:hypothetical protein
MHTLDPLCEQIVPGTTTPEEEDGKLGGGGPEPRPLQGGGDPESEQETGGEGTGP